MPSASMSEVAPGSAPVAKISWQVPWFVWIAVLSVPASIFGVQWDISWHRSIGRDTFWSPPHVMIYLGAVLAGIACGYQILGKTFGRPAERAASVRIWGFYGPLGAFISAWGGIAMLASAPFDNWWHNAYGLDIKILSPPHVILAIGLMGLQLGALIFIAGMMNRANPQLRARLTMLFLLIGGFFLIGLLSFQMEIIRRAAQHSGIFYRVVGTGVPFILLGVGRASGHRFGATIIAAVYTIEMLLLMWLFPFVPATPKLGPVYHLVTHLIPPGFPLLLIVPALGFDLLTPRIATRPLWLQSILFAATFLILFMMVQWPFAEFLLAPASRNWMFGTHYVGYNTRSYWPELRHQFSDLDGSLGFYRQLGLALIITPLSVRLGLAAARWLRGLQR